MVVREIDTWKAFSTILSTLLWGFFVSAGSFSQETNQSTQDQAVTCGLSARELIIIEVEVMKTDGTHVSGLGLEEFTLYENGEQQKIAYFLQKKEPDVGIARIKYLVGYYPDLRPDYEPRRLRIRVRKWKSKRYEVIYYPSWYLPEFDNLDLR